MCYKGNDDWVKKCVVCGVEGAWLEVDQGGLEGDCGKGLSGAWVRQGGGVDRGGWRSRWGMTDDHDMVLSG